MGSEGIVPKDGESVNGLGSVTRVRVGVRDLETVRLEGTAGGLRHSGTEAGYWSVVCTHASGMLDATSAIE